MFCIARIRRVRVQKKRMLFLSQNTEISPQGLNHMEGIRHIFVAARLQYGHKISPSKLISSGLDVTLALLLRITTRLF
jgi:hypothetical protein